MIEQTIYYAKMKTPLGVHLWIAKSGRGVCRIEFGHSESEFRAMMARVWLDARLINDGKALQKPLAELKQYFAGRRREFTFRQFMIGTGFQQLVWQAVSEIPYGQVATYKMIAEKIRCPHAVRAVGHANGSNPLPIVIPCHRVIGSNGDLCGYGGGIELKRRLLEFEGAAWSQKR
ncbi:MAG: Methylated-DNA--protein-cysteine methyltransferase [bacterium]|nr:Methylated-DNA--protein-cysteine methyltransferase [bacterium]